MDRSGFVLGRTRTAAECLAILVRQFGGFSPPAPETVRFRLRVLVSDTGQVLLAGFPLFTEPAPIERRLQRKGFRIVDRLHADVGVSENGDPFIAPPTWDHPLQDLGTTGHLSHRNGAHAAIDGILLLSEPGLSYAAATAQITAAADGSGDRNQILDRAESLAALAIREVPNPDLHELYSALAR